MAWTPEDITLTDCPDPAVVGATAASAVSVIVTFDRHIDPASVNASGAQFTFDGGLVATAAAVTGDGTEVTVTTTPQVIGTTYEVTVASSVQDTLGAGIDATMNSAVFAA